MPSAIEVCADGYEAFGRAYPRAVLARCFCDVQQLRRRSDCLAAQMTELKLSE